jgi:oxygen-independent coproporphyrinogen-3 oxidase
MYGLPGQTSEQWKETVAKTIALEPEHISTYCLTYEEDTEFFLRHARGELRSNSDTEADFFELATAMLEAAGYEHYEISNYARPGFSSVHNRAYWQGHDYLGIGPSAFSTRGMRRWQNLADYRGYADRVLSRESPVASVEELTPADKRTERIALCLRTREGVPPELLGADTEQIREFIKLGLMQESNGRLVLTRAGKSMADSVAEAFV